MGFDWSVEVMILYGIEIIEPPDGWATLEAMLLSYRPVPRELFTLAAGAVPAQNFSDIPPCVAALLAVSLSPGPLPRWGKRQTKLRASNAEKKASNQSGTPKRHALGP